MRINQMLLTAFLVACATLVASCHEISSESDSLPAGVREPIVVVVPLVVPLPVGQSVASMVYQVPGAHVGATLDCSGIPHDRRLTRQLQPGQHVAFCDRNWQPIQVAVPVAEAVFYDDPADAGCK